jgi:hypothetical protein
VIASRWHVASRRIAALALLALPAFGLTQGCGARTELAELGPDDEPCEPGISAVCGSNVGICREGTKFCQDDQTFGPCLGAVEPLREACNGIDDDCDGTADDGFRLGEACDGTDNDLCNDDVMTCEGCTPGTPTFEICNGRDDDCDDIVDADCEVGNCQPTLVVTGSTPSSPSCVDFPVEKSSRGVIAYPCGGGAVSAELGSVGFTGTVTNGNVRLTGTRIISVEESPDDCVWRTDHLIEGNVSSGRLSYSYSEVNIQGTNCWFPCTETGTIEVQWVE